jgi:hypothetical protein
MLAIPCVADDGGMKRERERDNVVVVVMREMIDRVSSMTVGGGAD